MSLLASFDLSTRALRAFQVAIQTISHNISNVNTPGYSRQRVLYSTENSDFDGRFHVGRGVQVEGVERLRNEFLEVQYRREYGGKGESGALVESYQLAEDLLSEPGDKGLNAQLTRFRDAWSNLSNNPSDPGQRAVLRTEGRVLTETFNRLREGFTDLRLQTEGEIRSLVPDINAAAEEIFALNTRIETATLLGQQPNDALDRRDKLIADLSELVPLRIINRESGTISVYLGGAPLVEATGPNSLEAVQKSGDILGVSEIRWKEFDEPLVIGNGRLKGLMDARDTVFPGMMDELDTLSSAVVEQVNTLHRTGMGLDGSVEVRGSKEFTGTLASNVSASLNGVTLAFAAGDDLATIAGKINLEEATTGVHASALGHRLSLTPSSTATPQTIRVTADGDRVFYDLGIVNDFFQGAPGSWALSDAVANDTDAIAASASGAPGDNDIARSMAALWDQRIMDGGTRSFQEYHQGFLADVGGRSEAARRADESQDFILQQVENMRDSVSGVSTEEELTNLIKFQRAFEMAARSVRAADEMLLTLINMIQR
ncbi:MAG: flagellar hook-associated protein FlgK [Elusimicrobia bacterium]|nr:flagellar hook-associated protein FlgK [Elusimicrobiota bacterium]